MYRGTTPLLPLRIKSIDLTEAKIFATVTDCATGEQLTYVSGTDFVPELNGNDTVCNIRLSQADTLKLKAGPVEVQVRYIFSDGFAGATTKTSFRAKDVLLDGVIAYAEQGG